MAFESITAAFFGLGAALPKKKESAVAPFKRTLDLANKQHEEAVEKLTEAANALVEEALAEQKRKKEEET